MGPQLHPRRLGGLQVLVWYLIASISPASTCPSLTISISTFPGKVLTNKVFRSWVKLSNHGLTEASDIAINVDFPVNTALVGSISSGGDITTTSTSISWSSVSVSAGRSKTYTFNLQPSKCAPEKLVLNASASSDGGTCIQMASTTVSIHRFRIEPTCSPTISPTSSPTSSSTPTSSLMVECGVTLPASISNWPMGQCGNRTTADPRVFGPPAWRTFHIFAQNYPTQPQPQVIQACVNFINAIPFMLPCPHCGYDFAQFIIANIEYNGTYNSACAANSTYNMPCYTPETACTSQGLLIDFFLRAHHNVDLHNKPCKPLWSRQQATDAFTYDGDFCATCIVWGTVEVCKSINETDCALVNTTEPCGRVEPSSPSLLPPTPSPTASPTSLPNLIVECGVPLPPSISNWPMGQCGNRTTADPRIFGPLAWRTFHLFAQNYPTDPQPQVVEACVNFINAIPFLLPCPHCGYDFAQFIVANIENAGTFNASCAANVTYNMPCYTPETACLSQSLLIDFFLRAHHNVDLHNKPCKPLWSRQQAWGAFAYDGDFCATCIVWGTEPICKSLNETGCAHVNTTVPCQHIEPGSSRRLTIGRSRAQGTRRRLFTKNIEASFIP